MSDIISTPVSTSGVPTPEVKTVEVSEAPAPTPSEILSQQTSAQDALPEPVLEVSQEEPKEEAKPQEDQRLTSRFQELKRREREAHKMAAEIKEKEAQIKRLEELKASPNLLERLKAVDLSFEDLVEYVVNDGQPKQPTLEDKVTQLESKFKDKEEAELKAVEQAKQQEYEATVSQYIDTVKTIASSDEKYELIHTTESYNLVSDLVLQVAETYGRTLPIHEAMALVEAKLQEEAEEKILKANKIRNKFMSPQAEHQANNQAKPQVPKTLSSSQSPQTTVKPADHNLTREEARERALAMLRFN